MTIVEFESLWAELSPSIYYRLLKTTGDDASDILQNLAVNTLQKLDRITYEGHGKFYSWLVISAELERKKYYRDNNKTPHKPLDHEVISNKQDDGLDISVLIESNIMVYEIYHQLSPKEQTLFELRLINDLPYSEIASIIGKSEESIMTALSRLRKKLKKILKKIGYEV